MTPRARLHAARPNEMPHKRPPDNLSPTRLEGSEAHSEQLNRPILGVKILVQTYVGKYPLPTLLT